MIVYFSITPVTCTPLCISGETVELVTEYKYLRSIIDNTFCFNQNANAVYTKLNSRMPFERKLNKLRIDKKIMDLIYFAIIQSVMSFFITCWYGSYSLEVRRKLSKIIQNCMELGIENSSSLADIYKRRAFHRCEVITIDLTPSEQQPSAVAFR